jgi:hypothetical protein
MTTEEAVLALRADPQLADLVRDTYLGRDVPGLAAWVSRWIASMAPGRLYTFVVRKRRP